jgi:4-amino-4-deoxy-L-arabinose transferase-like glycosyltransferase
MSAFRPGLAAALAVAAILRLFRIGSQSLWVDEAFSWHGAGVLEPWGPARYLAEVHGPLYGILLHGWSRIVGDSEWALRLPSAFLGVALVAAIARLAARWLGEETALPAAWLAAGSPFLIWYGQEARNYTLLMLCACLASLALLHQREAVTRRALAGYIAAAWAGLLSNLSFSMLGPVHARWWLATPGRPWRRLARAAGVGALLLVLISPWAGPVRRVWDLRRLEPVRGVEAGETPLRGAGAFHAAAIPFAAVSFSVGYTLGPSLRELRASPGLATVRPYALPLAAAGLVFGTLTALGAGALHRRGRLGEAVLWIVVPVGLLTYFAVHNFKVFHPRYLAVTVPGFLALLAAALADLTPRRRRLAGLAVAMLWTVSLAHHYFDPRYRKEDMRGAGRLLAARAVVGEKILAVNTETLLFYYYRGPVPISDYWLGWAADPALCERHIRRLSPGASGVWIVWTRGEDLDPNGAFARNLAAAHPDLEEFQFDGVRVWHYRRPPTPEAVPVPRS